jgi:PAS domain-containing protein
VGADRSEAEQLLRASEEKFRKVFATSPDAINAACLLGEVRC